MCTTIHISTRAVFFRARRKQVRSTLQSNNPGWMQCHHPSWDFCRSFDDDRFYSLRSSTMGLKPLWNGMRLADMDAYGVHYAQPLGIGGMGASFWSIFHHETFAKAFMVIVFIFSDQAGLGLNVAYCYLQFSIGEQINRGTIKANYMLKRGQQPWLPQTDQENVFTANKKLNFGSFWK